MKVIAARADSYLEIDKGMSEILQGLGGLEKYIKPGDRVLPKPNLVEGMPPEKAVNTHPWVFAERPFLKRATTLFLPEKKRGDIQ